MRRIVPTGAVLLLVAGCGSGAGENAHIALTSSAFAPGGRIPGKYTCDGPDVSLPLEWSGVPGAATELRLVMQDLDAPGGDFIHWQLSGLSPRSSGLTAGTEPALGNEGTNGFGTTGYRGPCPPRGARPHHYLITLTALSSDAIVGSGTLTGTYSRG